VSDFKADNEPSLIYMLGRVNQGIQRRLRNELKAVGLSIQEYTTLSVLKARPALSNAQLARRALVTPQSMIEILAKLEQRQLITRETDPSHALIRRARLTERGETLLDQAEPAALSVEQELIGHLPAKDRAATARALRTAMEGFSESHPAG
jgi:DNA-binding MarR family transcriptional regulator